jgi:hypothetical protein
VQRKFNLARILAQGFEMQDTASVCAVMEQRNGIKR